MKYLIIILLFITCNIFAQDAIFSSAQSIYNINLVKEHERKGNDVYTTGFVAYKYFNNYKDTLYIAMNLYDSNYNKLQNDNQIIMVQSFDNGEQFFYDRDKTIKWLVRNYYSSEEINEILSTINMIMQCPK